MNLWLLALCIFTYAGTARGAAVVGGDDVKEQGLYSSSDNVEILTNLNFDKKVFHKPYALIVQFYNSYCGHCRAFSPKYKRLAGELVPWRNILRLAVIDCSVEENNDICREFEVLAYPTMRYMHENYVKANGNLGEDVRQVSSDDELKTQIIHKLQSEQANGRANQAPSLNSSPYTSYSNAMMNVPTNTLHTFFVFENENSTAGSEIALTLHNYPNILVKRVHESSELAVTSKLTKFPAVIVLSSSTEVSNLTPVNPTIQNYIRAINTYLKSKNYVIPETAPGVKDPIQTPDDANTPKLPDADAVYYSDLENTLRMSLNTEITRHPTLTGEPLQSLIDYLDVLISSFPFRGNLKEFITGLRATILSKTSWSGSELHETVKQLEQSYKPYLTTTREFIACKGSAPKYRGYTCGVWTLFHTLTVNAARKSGLEGPKVLRAMHGYIKNFFGCTECAEHFQAMAVRNKLFDVKENDKAVLWLWISHNEVNLRLAGDVTEDPHFPKIQFPSISRCSACRLARGAWNLPAVYEYLQSVYGADHLRDARRPRSPTNALAPSPFSDLDIGMLSLLYLTSFIIVILVIKYFLTRGFYRKRLYKHGLGKV